MCRKVHVFISFLGLCRVFAKLLPGFGETGPNPALHVCGPDHKQRRCSLSGDTFRLSALSESEGLAALHITEGDTGSAAGSS